MKLDKFDFKMHMVKQAINYIAPRILGWTKGIKPSTPQSLLIERAWTRLMAVYEKDIQTGCMQDKNFRVLLEATRDALIFLCEKDRYYKRWLGLLAWILSDEVQNVRSNFSYVDAIAMACRPVDLTEPEYNKHRGTLLEVHLTGYLLALERSVFYIKREATLELPGQEPGASVDLTFIADGPPFWAVFLRDRQNAVSQK
jgi:hypothetical protein